MQWWDLTPDIARRATEDAADWHANAAETSIMLVLRPELVDTDKMRDADVISTAPKVRSSAMRCSMSPPTASPGFPSRATKSMGLDLWQDVVAAVRDVVERAIHGEKPPLGQDPVHRTTAQQHRRRADDVSPGRTSSTRRRSCFPEKAQTTMSDIARALGLQQSSLYYWFRNKEQLLQETPCSVNRHR